MASEILGLFTSPEQYRAMQGQQTQNEALQYAALNPFQRADVSLYTGVKQLGQATGRLFGVEDPQLKKITMRQQMITGAGGGPRINLNDPESMRRAAVIAQEQDDPEFAMFLAKKADEIQLSQANVQAKLRERPANVATPIQIAQARAELQDTIARLEADQVANPNDPNIARSLAMAKNTLAGLQTAERQGQVPDAIEIARERATLKGLEPGTTAYNNFVDTEIGKLTSKADRVTAYGADRNAIAQGEFGSDFADLTQAQKKAVNAIADREKQNVAAAGAPKQPFQKDVKDIPGFREIVINTVKPFRNTVTAADQAIQSINDSLKTGNFISFNAARTQLAKALGDGTLSRRDVEQAGGDPSILGGLADTASTMFTGTPTADTQKKIKSTLMAIRKVAREKGQSEVAIQKQIAEESGYNERQMKAIFNFPEFETKGKAAAPEVGRTNETIPSAVANRITQPPAKGQKQTRTLKSGKTVTVETE